MKLDLTDKKILITGGTGFLGNHVRIRLEKLSRFVTAVGSRDFDLTREDQVEKMFLQTQPEIVFHFAGHVGGIQPNLERPADFYYKNLMMGTLVFQKAQQNGVKKLVAAGAGCGYPQDAPLPLRETSLWQGWPQTESAPYSLAKRMLVIQAKACFQQHGFQSAIGIPGNVFGEFDNFNLENGHVIPALIRKFVEAVESGAKNIEIWGDGSQRRDFVYAGDVADGFLRLAETAGAAEIYNLSLGQATSIREICQSLGEITGYKGDLSWNLKRPTGQARRQMDVRKAREQLGFECRTSLYQGLKKTTEWFTDNHLLAGVRL